MVFQKWLAQTLVPIAFITIICMFSDVAAVEAMHYRGGTISWGPGPNYNSSHKEINFSFRLGWKFSHTRCDNETVGSGKLLGTSDQQWLCSSGCSGPVGPTSIRCIDFNEEMDYTVGHNTFNHVFNTDGPFEISYMYCCWTSTTSTDETSQWSLSTSLLLGERSDTGRPNNAPVVVSPLTIIFEPGVSAAFRLDILDADNDITRCRLGRHIGECGNVCDINNEFVFDQENCLLVYQPSSNLTGLFPFSFVVEDFTPRKTAIQVGDVRVRAGEPLSSVPFQFIVDVGGPRYKSNNCANVRPRLEIKPANGGSSVVKTNRLFEAIVTAQTCGEDQRIQDFQLSGPHGTSRSTTSVNENGVAQIVLSWRPTRKQEGLSRFCAKATQSDNLRSDEVCMNVFVDSGLSYCRGTEGSQYITFDSRQYSFIGECKYQLAVTTFNPSEVRGQDLQPFNISVLNDVNGGDGRPSIETIFVTIAGYSVELHRNKRLIMNGARIYPPVRLSGVQFDYSGRFVVMTADSGATLRYDGFSTYAIGLPSRYRGHMKGLCGNFNGNPADDTRMKRTGTEREINMKPAEYASHLQIYGSGCQRRPPRDEVRCHNRRRMLNQHVCGFISKEGGCFDACHSTINPAPFFETCVDALCNSPYSRSSFAAQVGLYSDACQVEGITVCDWRRRTGAALECPPNAHYSLCGFSVLRTCADLSYASDRTAHCVEGCECNDGFVLSGVNCVPESFCGCFIQGSYRLPGFTYRTNGCTHQCTCLEQNNTQCTPAPPCGQDERCGMLDNGFIGCTARKELDKSPTLRTTKWQDQATLVQLSEFAFEPCTQGQLSIQRHLIDGNILRKQSFNNKRKLHSVNLGDHACVNGSKPLQVYKTVRINFPKRIYQPEDKDTYEQRATTCKVFGDHHYLTFDGVAYDSMSTCAHILVRSRADSLLTPFTVIGINGQARSNNTVSHIKEVQVSVGGNYNLNITLSPGPVIKMNGFEVNPGSTIRGVAIRMTSVFVVLTFDFGLVIRWDGVDRLRLSAWSPLRGQIEGLCGNYDGDASNDFAASDGGGLITDVATFINSWRITGTDLTGNQFPEPPENATEVCMREGFTSPSQLAECLALFVANPGSCLERQDGNLIQLPNPCEDQLSKKEVHRQACYILVDPAGPFLPCHDAFDPFTAFKSCMFDMCAYDGNATIREHILSSYDYDCRERNVTIQSWRDTANTPMICGENSAFDSCVSQCEPSCDDPEGRRCKESLDMDDFCEEGCKCEEGFVRSNAGGCVPKDSCGCILNGLYQQKGFTYRRNNCTQECECVGDGEVSCRDVKPCAIKLTCSDDNLGYQRCTGRLRRRATCKAVTDPHYMTFDGTTYDSMGTCAYIMVQNRQGSSAPNFQVIAVNENPLPHQIVSHVRDVHVKFGDNKTMSFYQGPRVTLDGVEIVPGTEMDGFVVRMAGRFIVVEFDFRLVIRWDGEDRLRITAWQPLRNMVEGLCGDFDDDSTNDWQTSWGQVTTDLDTFVRSWEVQGYDTEGCVLPPPKNISETCRTKDNLLRFGEECSVLTDPEGPFAGCHEEADPWPSYRDCVYDLCVYNGSSTQKDRIFTSYITDCESAGQQPNEGWREFVDLPPDCPENMHYNSSGLPCQPTCSDRDATACLKSENIDTEVIERVEGCECSDGFILSGMKCVPVEECGCMIDGMYYPIGFIQRNEDCSQECVCLGSNNMSCYDAPPCPRRSKCKIDTDGFRRCVNRPRRRATCKAVTDPHYMTFDGTRFDSMGMCSYIMVRSKSNATVPEFMVVAVNQQPEPHRIVSHVKEVYVHFGRNQTMQFGPGKPVKLNGVTVNPGFNRDGIEVRASGQFTVVDWEWGLVVKWDGEDRVRIVAWAPLRQQIEGVCGDFDDNPDNDFTSPSGDIISNIDAFVNSWIIEGYGAEGCPDNPAADATAVLPGDCVDEDVLMRHSNACYVLIDPEGPIAGCQSVVDVQAAFQSCLFDQCAYDGDPAMKDRLISSYLDTCLDEDDESREDNDTERMQPSVWRPMANLTDPDCPANSHYTLCMAQCQRSCDDPDASICARNPRIGHVCVQGCEADNGYLLSGGAFVPPSHCGCTVDGKYYMDGQRFMTDACDSICECNERVVSCNPAGCQRNEECRPNQDGDLACLPFRTVACERTGNGHYVTFDKLSYTFKGACSYVLAMSTDETKAWQAKVETETANQMITRVKSATFSDQPSNLTIDFHLVDDQVRVEVNNVEVASAWSTRHGGTEFKIRRRGRFTTFSTSMGTRMEFDGNQLLLHLPIYMANEVAGLCGNFNGQADDDIPNLGSDDNSIPDFASNHRLEECAEDHLTNVCTEEHYVTGHGFDHCGVITNVTGPLWACNRVVRSSTTRRFFQQCVDDYCSSGGNRTVLELAIQSYAHECLSSGIRICDWREKSGFPTTCPPNMHHDGCASCQAVCGEPPADNDCPLMETCVCDTGFILKGSVCVPHANCGCLIDGVASTYGEDFTKPNCIEECTCFGVDTTECREIEGCKANEVCLRADASTFSCARRPPDRATCSILSGRHFYTFDGSAFDFPAKCTYTIVRSRDLLDQSRFIITARFNPTESLLSRVHEIRISFDDYQRTVILRADGTVETDGFIHQPGGPREGVNVENIGKYTVITLPMGLVVRWNLNGSLRIDAWKQLKGKIEGLCGNFDDDITNDVSSDVLYFANLWESPLDVSSCMEEISSEPPFPCDDQRSGGCVVLLQDDGPFSSCHDLVPPLTYYDDCVFDACANTTTEAEQLVISDYARACRNEGGTPTIWRDISNTTTICPVNSHYNSCAQQCQPTCSDTDASRCRANALLGDNCEEACQCEEGYLKDNGDCILPTQCGCMTSSGMYIKENEAQMVDNCTNVCQCIKGNLSCTPTFCYDDQYCGVRENEQGCHWTDECEYNNGGCSHTCESVDGVAVCSCPEGYVLDPDMKKCNKTAEDPSGICDDDETELETLTRWREATFVEWRSKLRKYIDTFSSSFENPNQQSTICGNRWTEWLDRDNPGGLGDDESLNLLQLEFPRRICRHPVAIEARLVDGRPATASGNHVIMSAHTGLRCDNDDQPNGVRCADFEVRFLCLETLV